MNKNKNVETFILYASPISELMEYKDVAKQSTIYVYKVDTDYVYA
jgi:hypothetical protein